MAGFPDGTFMDAGCSGRCGNEPTLIAQGERGSFVCLHLPHSHFWNHKLCIPVLSQAGQQDTEQKSRGENFLVLLLPKKTHVECVGRNALMEGGKFSLFFV